MLTDKKRIRYLKKRVAAAEHSISGLVTLVNKLHYAVFNKLAYIGRFEQMPFDNPDIEAFHARINK